MAYKIPRGTRDILPDEVGQWQVLEGKFRDLCARYGYLEIRTPVFEHTELFARSVGEDSDIVSKEMYTFQDRSGRDLTLRPEMTAAVVRSFLENHLMERYRPVKLYYIGPIFRYDRPQSGRYRQFHQCGLELFGPAGPAADAEIIALAAHYLNDCGLTDVSLELNNIGCPACRPAYREKLLAFLQPLEEKLCGDCRRRFKSNPLRVLDCKRGGCRSLVAEAPLPAGTLCGECEAHFLALQALLQGEGINFQLNPRLVRGLDYYSRTAFEFIAGRFGAGLALGGGGRYDCLVEVFGGPPVPAVGVALGVERIVLAMEKENLWPQESAPAGVFLAIAEPDCREEGLALLYQLRAGGIKAETDYLDRSLKAQMKYAHRHNFRYAVIWGKEEGLSKKIKLRDLLKGEQQEIPPGELLHYLSKQKG